MNDNNGLKEPVASSLPAELSLAFTGTQLLKVSAVGLVLGITSYGDNDRGAPGLFHIYVFNSSNGRFNPPGDCGSEHPNDILSYDFPCAEIGVTPRGDRIYHHISDFSNQYNTYAKMGDSVVVLASNDDHMDKSELLRIMGSLQPTTARELKALYGQDNKK